MENFEDLEKRSFVFVPIEIRGATEKQIVKELQKQRSILENQLEFAKKMLRYYVPTSDELRKVLAGIDNIKR